MFSLVGRHHTRLLLVATLFLLASCITVTTPIMVSRAQGFYVVEKSDTLYSIAWRYGLDYKRLALWNQIDVNAPIFPGQELRLMKPPDFAVVQQSPNPATPKKAETAVANSATKTKATSTSTTVRLRNPKKWLWPTQGKVLNKFLATNLNQRGVDISGKLGQPVLAVADGKVVYSGNGLSGYGNLIIIKHSDTFLSAYAYCQKSLVREGMSVNAGSVVAHMGRKDDIAKLHFQIRRNGKPVDPLKYLPKR